MSLFTIKEDELASYLKQISSGNEEVLEKFYEQYGRSILALILSFVRSRESAEEVLQDVLMAIVTHPQDKPIGNARGWLFKVIHNISMKKVMEDSSKQASSSLETEVPAYDEDICERLENGIDQIEALNRLKPLEQQCVIMRVFWRLKLPKVAELIGLPYHKVRAVYQYAVKKLRKYYEERNGSA